MIEADLNHREAEIKINHIKTLYLEARSGGIPTKEQLLTRNITPYFWLGILRAIENKELINIAIRGKTGSSKSTVGCKILYVIITKMIKEGTIRKPLTERELNQYMYTRINSDQTEFLRFAMKEKGNTASLIDEFSSMGETGFNATIEKALYEEHSDLFAQENINKISCSPSHINDRNADIILDIIGIDKKRKITQAMLNYRDQTEWITFPLGVVNIYVGDIIEMPFYKEYRVKKFRRLDLLKKHGIPNVKVLEFSRVIMETYNKMIEIAKIRRPSQEVVLGVIECVREELKMQFSIPTLNYLTMQVRSLIILESEISCLKKKMIKATSEEELERIRKGIIEYRKLLNRKIEREEEKIKIEKEYREVK